MRLNLAIIAILWSLSLAAWSGEAAVLRVACVGDSITAGARVPEAGRYPKLLEGLLGEALGRKVEARNFGSSGATLLKKGDVHPLDAGTELLAKTICAGITAKPKPAKQGKR